MTGDEETLIRADERARIVRLLEKIAVPHLAFFKAQGRLGKPFATAICDAIKQVRATKESPKP